MPPVLPSSLLALEENPREVYLEITSLLLRLANNVIEHPSNPKFRSIRLANPTVANKLLPAVGAMECLFDMGFQEAEDSLVLPDNTSLDNLRKVRDSILARRNSLIAKPPIVESKTVPPPSSTSETPPPCQKELSSSSTTPISATSQQPSTMRGDTSQRPPRSKTLGFLDKVVEISASMSQLYTQDAIRRAKKYIPLTELEIAAQEQMRKIQQALKSVDIAKGAVKESEPSVQELILLQLLSWFKEKFFTWVNNPPCNMCSRDTKFKRTDTSGYERIEVYECPACLQEIPFPRYADPQKLLESRKGRCGEWARCFTLMCYSLGWDARLVFDETDHVWTEVFCPSQNRWLHCDPCENALDRPLMYECGWAKKLSYIIAYSLDDVQDVTWRYSASHKETLQRRRQCTEVALVDTILMLRKRLQQNLSAARKSYLCKRTLFELVELWKEPSKNGSYEGRQSGSLEWRLARAEVCVWKPYTWRPNESEIQHGEMRIQYQSGLDQYTRGPSSTEVPIQGWQNGIYLMESMHRKEENDWKVVYLARSEGSSTGRIVWYFDVSGSGMMVDCVKLICTSTVFHSGQVQILLCGESMCVKLPPGKSELNTVDLRGSTFIKLAVDLSGGEGQTAWQHAQLFRSAFDSSDVVLDVSIKLKPVKKS